MTAEAQCTDCDGGKYCPNSGMTAPAGNCTAGYYCSSAASTATPTDGTTGNECPIGSYCPEGTATPKQCDPGTYTDTKQNYECLQCTPGQLSLY